MEGNIVDWSVHSHLNCAAHLRDEQHAIELVKNGQSYSAVGKMLNVNRNTVANWCVKYGVKSSYPANTGDERIDLDVVSLINSGMSYVQTAHIHNINVNRVKRICKKHNVVSHHIKKN